MRGWRGTRTSGARIGRRQHVPAASGPADEAIPRPAVSAEAGHRVLQRSVHHARAAVVERVDERDLRLDQLEAVAVEARRREERRGTRHRVDGRAHVVPEPGQRQLRGARSPADGVGGLEHDDRASGLGDGDRRGEPVRTGSHDHDIGHVVSLGCS